MMLFKPFTLLLTTLAAAASNADGAIPADSRLGRSLLQNARSLENNNNNAAYQDGSWMANYSIKFHSCATNDSFYGDYFNGNNQNGNGDQGFNGVYKQRLAHFQLCPSDTCGSSGSGCNSYVTDLADFLSAYIQNEIAMESAKCESVKNTCYCENGNDDATCLSSCYSKAGLKYCEQGYDDNNNNGNNNGNNNQISVLNAIYCQQLEVSDQAMEYYQYEQNTQNNNNNNGQARAFYVGPICQNGKILLTLFTEETCSEQAASGTYEKMFYGLELPYSSTSIIESKCLSCKVPTENDANQNNNANGYYYQNGQMYKQEAQENNQDQEAAEVTESCGNLYQQSGRCEESLHLSGVYPDTRACNFIHNLKDYGGGTLSSLRNGVPAAIPAKVLAGLFAATTVGFAGYSAYVNQKLKRSRVALVHGGNCVA